MDIKVFFKQTKVGFILKNLGAAVLLGLLMLFFLLLWLKRYTEHGIEISVPDVTGMYFEEAKAISEHEGLRMQVIDSTYTSKVPLGTIVEQNPVPLNRSKHGRTIYVILNANNVRQVPVPDLQDISLRQAVAMLNALNIGVSNYIYEPSEYKDIIVDVRKNGKSLTPGERIDEGSEVTLVIGRGKKNVQISVPNLCGKKLSDARSMLFTNYLALGNCEYDIRPTEETKNRYIVYRQEPAAGSLILEGSRVDLYLSSDIEKAITTTEQIDNKSEDDFF